MPTVLRTGPYRFFFYAGDRDEPLHIHVERDDSYPKFWLNPVSLARSRGFKSHELTELRIIVHDNAPLFQEKWHEHLRDQGRTVRG